MPEFFSYIMILGAVSTADTMPYWATANQYGLMPESSGIMMQAQVGQKYNGQKTFQYHWCLSLAGTSDKFSPMKVIPDEIYAGVKWKMLSLDLGMWHQSQSFFGSDPLLGSLSSTGGNFTWTGNARSMPGYALNLLPVSISGRNNYVELMGRWADYRTTDYRYIDGAWVHNMNAAIRFNYKQFSLTSGIDHWAMWNGTDPWHGKMPSSLCDYFRVCVGLNAGYDGSLSDQINVLGDHRGAIFFQFDYKRDDWKFSVRYDHPYEDKSGMRFQNFPDGVYGLNFSFTDKNRWVSDVMFEYIYTMNQSGPLHERPASEEEKAKQNPEKYWYGYVVLGGADDYFNNGDYKSGWTHYGRTIGLPLLTPTGTKDGTWDPTGITYGIENNRIKAVHFGLSGKLFRKLPYRMMLTYSDNYGTFQKHRKPEEYVTNWPGYSQFSAGLSFIIPFLKGKLQLLPALYLDSGQTRPNSFAATIGLRIFP